MEGVSTCKWYGSYLNLWYMVWTIVGAWNVLNIVPLWRGSLYGVCASGATANIFVLVCKIGISMVSAARGWASAIVVFFSLPFFPSEVIRVVLGAHLLRSHVFRLTSFFSCLNSPQFLPRHGLSKESTRSLYPSPLQLPSALLLHSCLGVLPKLHNLLRADLLRQRHLLRRPWNRPLLCSEHLLHQWHLLPKQYRQPRWSLL